jgi:hypothetical protein
MHCLLLSHWWFAVLAHSRTEHTKNGVLKVESVVLPLLRSEGGNGTGT